MPALPSHHRSFRTCLALAWLAAALPLTAHDAHAQAGLIRDTNLSPIPVEAVESLKARSSSGDLTATLELGVRTFLGSGIPGDPFEGARLVLEAARRGQPIPDDWAGRLNEATRMLLTTLARGREFRETSALPPSDPLASGLQRLASGGADRLEGFSIVRQAAVSGHPLATTIAARILVAAGNEPGAISFARTLAADGNLQAMAVLGSLLMSSKPDASGEGVTWLRKAADQGSARAQFDLAIAFRHGIGVTADPDASMIWLRKAAEEGLPQAQAYYGALMSDGIGISKDEAQAVEWLRKGAEQGDPDAQYNLGLAIQSGRGVARDLPAAIVWLQRAADQGQADAESKMAYFLMTGSGVPKDSAAGFVYLRSAVGHGSVEAMSNLGGVYLRGDGVPRDPEEARRWFQRAADANMPAAQYQLGLMLGKGEGGARDPGAGAGWVRKAAERGYPRAQNTLAKLLFTGEGVPQNKPEGIEWLRKAADQGLAESQVVLAMCLNAGDGTPRNPPEAERYFRMAAGQEHPEALFALGGILEARGELGPALASYERAVAAAPAMPESAMPPGQIPLIAAVRWTKIGDVRLAMGNTVGAKDAYARSADAARGALAAGSASAGNTLGWALLLAGRWQEAREHLGRVVQTMPTSAGEYPYALANLASACLLMGDVDRALETYDRVLALKADMAESVLKDLDHFRRLGFPTAGFDRAEAAVKKRQADQ